MDPICPTPPESTASPPDYHSDGTDTKEDIVVSDLEIDSISVSDFIVYLLSGTHPVVTREPGTQYVTVHCETSLDPDVVRRRLDLRLDGESLPQARRQPYSWQRDTFDVAFAVSKTDTFAYGTVFYDDIVLQSLSDTTIERVNNPPAFLVSDPSVSPNYVRSGEETMAEVRITVENVCRGRGTFGASISGIVSGYNQVRATLDTGETRVVAGQAEIWGNSATSEVVLTWGTGRLRAEIPTRGTPPTDV